jgi:hypothetical protein
LIAWVLARRIRPGVAYLFRFFAGFCLVANGAYLGAVGFGGVGDAGDLLRYGCPPWVLVAFGLVAVPSGLSLWHGLGPYYGLGEARGRVSRKHAVGVFSVLVAVVLFEVVVGSGMVT